MKCAWCHSPIVDKDDGRNVNGEFNVHWWCVDWMDEKLKHVKDDAKRSSMVLSFLKKMSMAIAFVGILACGTAVLWGEELPEKEWVKGGVASKSVSGDCYYRPFIKVGTMDDDDEGNPQIIGYEPGNVHVSRIDGKVVWERVRERVFARKGFPAKGCAQKCPPYDE